MMTKKASLFLLGIFCQSFKSHLKQKKLETKKASLFLLSFFCQVKFLLQGYVCYVNKVILVMSAILEGNVRI
jgi:hypothetical protein